MAAPVRGHAHFLDAAAVVAQAGGVDQADRHAAEIDGLLDGVARRAGLGADNGALEAEQQVEQARLPGIRGTGDDQAQAVAQDPAALGGFQHAGDGGAGTR